MDSCVSEEYDLDYLHCPLTDEYGGVEACIFAPCSPIKLAWLSTLVSSNCIAHVSCMCVVGYEGSGDWLQRPAKASA